MRTRGIVAAGVLCAALAWATAFRLPVFFGADERTHFGYVVSVVEGRLPEVHDPLPTADDRFPVLARSMGYDRVPDEHRGPMLNVANHPPLFYVVAAPLTRLAAAVGSDALPPLAVRLLNGLCMGAGVVVTGLLARRLLPTVPQAGVVAAGVAAVTPNLAGVAAYGHNDGIGFALAAAALLVAVRLLQDGPDTRLVTLGAAVAVACALTRASLLVAVATVVAAAVIGGLRGRPGGHGRHGRRSRARPGTWPWQPWVAGGAVAGGAVAGSVAVLAGWFYLRNQDLYGSPTADGVLLQAFRREPRGTVVDVLRGGWFHAEMWTKLYGSVHPELVSPYRWWVFGVLAVAMGAGGLAILRRIVWPPPAEPAAGTTGADAVPDGEGEGGDPLPDVGLAGWALLAAYAVGVVVGVADFVSKGGSMHPRYLFALVPLTSILVAAAVAALPRRRAVDLAGVAGVAVVTGLLVVTLSQLARYGDLIQQRIRNDTLLLPDRPAAPVAHWLALGVAAVAFAVLAVELLRTRAGAGEATSRPSPAPDSRTSSRSAARALDGAA